jgi:hypothetical protein
MSMGWRDGADRAAAVSALSPLAVQHNSRSFIIFQLF